MKHNFLSKKLLKCLLFLAFVLLTAVIAVNLWIYTSVKDRILRADDLHFPDADCILVLGAGVRDDGSPSHMLEDRLLTGIDLYQSEAAPVMLMSGDHGQADYDEVGAMLKFAMEHGVPAESVFLDHAGFSTYESLYRARDVFGAERIVIVTQEYHLYRALYVAQSLGLDAVGVPADLRTYVGQVMRDTREIAARLKDFLWCLLKMEPTYLGEEIDLSGSGIVTH